MKRKTEKILTVMHILTWIAFIGLCIKTGAILYSFFVSLFINPVAAKNLYLGLNLSGLMEYNIRHYCNMVSLIVFLTGLKAYIAYLVVKIFLKFDISYPFSASVGLLISKISYVALGTGILALVAYGYKDWLFKRGVSFLTSDELSGGNGEFLFLAGVIFIIAQVFNRGIEIQSENDLTV